MLMCAVNPTETDGSSSIFDKLTDRQRQVVAYMMLGLTIKQIARKLSIEPATVIAHRKAIYNALEIDNGEGFLLKAFGPASEEKIQAIASDYDLTQRETEVLRHILENKPTKIIAQELEIATEIAKSHQRSITQKLRLHRAIQIPVLVHAHTKQPAAAESPSIFDKLTDRQGQVAAYLIQGMTAKEIAEEMRNAADNTLSEGTINTHIGKIYNTHGTPDGDGFLLKAFGRATEEQIKAAVGEYHLTPRETEFLGHIVDDIPVKEIAKKLGISLATAKVHQRSILEKLYLKRARQIPFFIQCNYPVDDTSSASGTDHMLETSLS